LILARQIQLGKLWTLGERIDGGGFGQVFVASSDDIEAVAKLVPKAPGAERELLFVDLGAACNVVPVIDSGEIDDAWVLVMPRAEKSLRRHLAGAGGALDTTEALGILQDIVAALADLDGHVVHRDIKPENVLLLDGHWCLADFGISRYAEATTAPDTRKFSMTPPYAAPDQWRWERATSAADVYALGVVAYELLAGVRPFVGPDGDDYRNQHLHEVPPRLQGVPLALAALVEECLYKEAGARPTPAELLRRLVGVTVPPAAPGLAKLQQVHHHEVGRQAEVNRRGSAAATSHERRERLFQAARQNFTGIAETLHDAIVDAAPSAGPGSEGKRREDQWVLRLGQATLRLKAPEVTPATAWGGPVRPAFDVIAHSTLSLAIPTTRHGYEGRSHSLWYCDPFEADRFGWYELAFMFHAYTRRVSATAPFALLPGPEAGSAFTPGMGLHQLAWPLARLTFGDHLDDFINRWGGWLAAAYGGELGHPSLMPEVTIERNWRTA
jgi:hypothetical protein